MCIDRERVTFWRQYQRITAEERFDRRGIFGEERQGRVLVVVGCYECGGLIELLLVEICRYCCDVPVIVGVEVAVGVLVGGEKPRPSGAEGQEVCTP